MRRNKMSGEFFMEEYEKMKNACCATCINCQVNGSAPNQNYKTGKAKCVCHDNWYHHRNDEGWINIDKMKCNFWEAR